MDEIIFDEIILKVEEYASLFMTIDEIAILLNMDPDSLRREIRFGKSPIAIAYLKGKLETIVEIRKQTVLFAKKGSPSAEQLIANYIANQKQNE